MSVLFLTIHKGHLSMSYRKQFVMVFLILETFLENTFQKCLSLHVSDFLNFQSISSHGKTSGGDVGPSLIDMGNPAGSTSGVADFADFQNAGNFNAHNTGLYLSA